MVYPTIKGPLTLIKHFPYLSPAASTLAENAPPREQLRAARLARGGETGGGSIVSVVLLNPHASHEPSSYFIEKEVQDLRD